MLWPWLRKSGRGDVDVFAVSSCSCDGASAIGFVASSASRSSEIFLRRHYAINYEEVVNIFYDAVSGQKGTGVRIDLITLIF